MADDSSSYISVSSPLFFSQGYTPLLKTLTTCPFLDLELALKQINLKTYHNELLNCISLFHQNNRSYRAIIIAEKLRASGLFVPEKEYEFILAAQKSGHVLGLNKPITLSINNEKKIFSTEGAVNHQSLGFLIEKIDAYLEYSQKHPIEKKDYAAFQLLSEALNRTIQKIYPHTHLYKPDSAKLLYEEYLNNKLIILTSGYKGHTVGMALLNGALVVCNRGPGTIPGKGTNIYPISQHRLVTEEWFRKIIDLDNKKNIQDFHSILSEVIELDSPKIIFPSKPQKHKNCSYANLKSLLEGILYLLLSANKKNILDQKNKIEIKNREKYKNFSNFSRSHELSLILKTILSSESIELKSVYYNQLLKIYFSKKKSPSRSYLKEYRDELNKDPIIFELVTEYQHNNIAYSDVLSPLKKNTSHLK